MRGLVYIGRIERVSPIPDADRIESVFVVCGKGGAWQAVVQKGQFKAGDACQVYLQDCIVPKTEEFAFMARSKYRVRMMRLRGAPSECLVMPQFIPGQVGQDVTLWAGVSKYEKPIPIGTDIMGGFPAFIPKTDEPNFQGVPEMVEALRGQPFYVTVKADGMSTTAYKHQGHFGVCSRNWELKEGGAQWAVAKRYDLPDKLPEGIALQWETIGPKIQGNPMGLSRVDMQLFDVWYINEHRYANISELSKMSIDLDVPMVQVVGAGGLFDYNPEDLQRYAEGVYPNGEQREGVVFRPGVEQLVDGKRLSFKVINLLYAH